jgi:integrase
LTLHRLSPLKLKTTRPGRYPDGGGLYLQVTLNPKTGAIRRSWVYRFERNGRERRMGLGSLDDITLVEAREGAAAARKLHHDGVDPIEARESARTARQLEATKAMTFDQCAEAYIAAHRPSWRSDRHLKQWNESREYVRPVLGRLPVQQIDTGLVLKILQPIWQTKAVSASRTRQRIESILDWATASGFRQGENPARWRGHLENLLPATGKIKQVKHLAALPYGEVGAFLAKLRARDDLACRALEFTILTATRSGEALGARWSEVDFESRVWTVPAERTKGQREHRVPLAPRALEILREIQNHRHVVDSRVFRLSRVSMWLEVPEGVTVHGFRSSFRDWCAEQTNFPREIAEAALGHIVGDSTERAYRRGDVLEKRRRLMEAWAAYCSKAAPAGEVVPLRSLSQ